MSWLGDKLEQIGNLPGPHRALLKFDARTITEASKLGGKVFGDNAIGHLFDWGQQEGQQNYANPGRQFSKGVQFYGKALTGQLIGAAIGAYFGGGATGATAAETGSVDNAMATWGTGAGPYAGSESWDAASAAGAAGGAGSDLRDWGKEGSRYPGSDQWSTQQGGTEATKAAGEKSVMKDIGRSVAIGAGTNVVTSLLTPKPKEPAIPPPTPMPDQQAMEKERRRKIAEQMARRGRAASILTSPGY